MHNALLQWEFDCQIFVHYPWSKGNSINAIITSQLHFKRLKTYICNFSIFSNSTKQLAQNLRFVFNILKIFFKMQFIFSQWLYYCSDAVFIQVPFENESSSTTEKQFRGYFQLKNETSRQVHKTSVIIVCCYIQNLLMTQFRCFRVSGALYVMCVEKTIRVLWKWFEKYTFQ